MRMYFIVSQWKRQQKHLSKKLARKWLDLIMLGSAGIWFLITGISERYTNG